MGVYYPLPQDLIPGDLINRKVDFFPQDLVLGQVLSFPYLHILTTEKGGKGIDLNWIWKAALIVIAGSMLLRVAGRKSISQLTVAQTVIMISIGSLIIQPVSGANVWAALAVALIMVVTLVVIELLEVRWDWLEFIFTGRAVIVIQDGKVVFTQAAPDCR